MALIGNAPAPAGRRRTLAAMTLIGLLAGTAAQAQDGGLFEALFGRPSPAPQQQVAPQPQFQPVPGYGSIYRHRSRRSERRPRTRYAALPRSEPLKVHISDRQKPIDMTGGPVAALMKDETLRPGDIVVLKTGARVFTGAVEKTHALRDFEPVQTSRLVDKPTRQKLAAMMTPIGALPADEARRQLARLKRTAPQTPVPTTTQASMRVINVWTER